jgi:tripartite-type tricarboxylate transporter receptor subunit TctC
MIAITRWFSRTALSALVAASMLVTAAQAFAGDHYPSRPIRLVVAYPPGGPLDVMARLLAEPLGQVLEQPVVVDNRAGAGGIIGSDVVSKAAPDGYTLLFGSTPLAIQETLMARLPYSALKDFTPIAKTAEGPQVLVVGAAVPVHTVRELIDYAKAKDGRLNYASPSTGGSNHLAAEMFKTMAGFKATHIPYKGGAPAETDLIGGQVTFMFGALTGSLQQAERGRLRVLAVTSKKRMRSAPDVPTIAETLPGFEVTSWYGVLGPPGLPGPIVAQLNAEINKVMNQPEMAKRLLALDLEAASGTSAQFAEFIRQNTAMWAKVIKDAHVERE